MLIDQPMQVRILAQDVRPWSKGFQGTVALALDALTPAENYAYQERLNELYGACGCGTGGVASVGALGLVLVAVLSGWAGFASLGPAGAVGTGLLAFLVGGALGKAIGLVHAHTRLKATLEELRERLEPPRPGRISRMPILGPAG